MSKTVPRLNNTKDRIRYKKEVGDGSVSFGKIRAVMSDAESNSWADRESPKIGRVLLNVPAFRQRRRKNLSRLRQVSYELESRSREFVVYPTFVQLLKFCVDSRQFLSRLYTVFTVSSEDSLEADASRFVQSLERVVGLKDRFVSRLPVNPERIHAVHYFENLKIRLESARAFLAVSKKRYSSNRFLMRLPSITHTYQWSQVVNGVAFNTRKTGKEDISSILLCGAVYLFGVRTLYWINELIREEGPYALALNDHANLGRTSINSITELLEIAKDCRQNTQDSEFTHFFSKAEDLLKKLEETVRRLEDMLARADEAQMFHFSGNADHQDFKHPFNKEAKVEIESLRSKEGDRSLFLLNQSVSLLWEEIRKQLSLRAWLTWLKIDLNPSSVPLKAIPSSREEAFEQPAPNDGLSEMQAILEIFSTDLHEGKKRTRDFFLKTSPNFQRENLVLQIAGEIQRTFRNRGFLTKEDRFWLEDLTTGILDMESDCYENPSVRNTVVASLISVLLLPGNLDRQEINDALMADRLINKALDEISLEKHRKFFLQSLADDAVEFLLPNPELKESKLIVLARYLSRESVRWPNEELFSILDQVRDFIGKP